MISLSHLNKSTLFAIFFIVLIFKPALGEEEPLDIWEKQEIQTEENNESDNEKDGWILLPYNRKKSIILYISLSNFTLILHRREEI